MAIAALSRYAVNSQVAPSSDVCRVLSSWGMAGMTRLCNRLNASAAVASTANVTAYLLCLRAIERSPEAERSVPITLARAARPLRRLTDAASKPLKVLDGRGLSSDTEMR